MRFPNRLVFVYLAATAAANLLLTRFGPSVAVFNAVVLIGLDLSTRDQLHEQWQGRALWPRMLALVVAGGLLSLLLGGSGRIALPLYDVHDGSPVAIATVHMPDLVLAADEVVIKNYSENEGMLNLLVTEGIISAPLREVPSGYVTLYICRCLL